MKAVPTVTGIMSWTPTLPKYARILLDVIRKLEAGYTDGSVIDVNGNKVGRWSYE